MNRIRSLKTLFTGNRMPFNFFIHILEFHSFTITAVVVIT